MNALSLTAPLHPRQRRDTIPLHGISRSTPLAKLDDRLAALTEPAGKNN